jgi:hypothetical protein
LPDPLPPLVIVIHEALGVAVHVQPPGAVTPTVPDVDPEATDLPVGESVNVQGIPDCVTVNVCPATVIVPERERMLGFAATL